MDLAQLANLGEFIGGIAVLFTLIYLAAQIRQNTSQMKTQTASSLTNSNQAAFDPVFLHFDTYFRGYQDHPNLTDQERELFRHLMIRIFNALQNSHYQQGQGALEASWMHTYGAVIQRILAFPGGFRFWAESGEMFTPEFKAFVDALVPPSVPNGES